MNFQGKSRKNVPLIVCVYDQPQRTTMQVDARDKRTRGETDMSISHGNGPHSTLSQAQVARLVAAAGTNSCPMVGPDGTVQGRMYPVTVDMVPTVAGDGYTVDMGSCRPSDLTITQATWDNQQATQQHNKAQELRKHLATGVKKLAIAGGLALMSVRARLVAYALNRIQHGLWKRDGSSTPTARRALPEGAEADESVEAQLARLELRLTALEQSIADRRTQIAQRSATVSDYVATGRPIVMSSPDNAGIDQRVSEATAAATRIDEMLDAAPHHTADQERDEGQRDEFTSSDELDRQVELMEADDYEAEETGMDAPTTQATMAQQRFDNLNHELDRLAQRFQELGETETMMQTEDQLLTNAETDHRRQVRSHKNPYNRLTEAVYRATNPTEAEIMLGSRSDRQAALDATGQQLSDQRDQIEAERARLDADKQRLLAQSQALAVLVQANAEYEALLKDDPGYHEELTEDERVTLTSEVSPQIPEVMTDVTVQSQTQVEQDTEYYRS